MTAQNMLTKIASGRVFDYSHNIGQYMGGMDWPGEGFVLPIATEVAANNTVYVLGRGAESTGVAAPMEPRAFGTRIGKFSIGATPGDEEHLLTFGSFGKAPGQFMWPTGIALDEDENVYITDEWLNRVSVFDKDGNLLSTWGSRGSGDGELNRISGITIDANGNVYLVDSLNHRVQKFTSEGKFLKKWGSLGDGEGQLNSPWGICLDQDGFVYIADHRNHRVQKWTPQGEFLLRFGSSGDGPGQLQYPSDVTVDPAGDVYICDWANNRVQVFDPTGAFLTSIVGDANEPSKWAQMTLDANADLRKARRLVSTMEPEWRFALPTGVTFDSIASRLIVADTQRYRLQIYNKITDYVEPQFNF